MSRSFATATAPASVGNAAVGFDLLGHALSSASDRVTASRAPSSQAVRIVSITGSRDALPTDADSNTASRAVMAMLQARGIDAGIDLSIEKGIPLASGLGGSAASAVAAVVAAASLLELDLTPDQLYPFALAGEAVASGAAHGDNVGCQLLGGLVLATADRLVAIPVPQGLTAVAVHPDYQVNTRDARQCLTEPFDLATVVSQSSNLALVLTGCHQSNFELIRAGLADVMVEPRRAALIPGFARVKQAALEHGALGASISGAGPTVFGWFVGESAAKAAGQAMMKAFSEAGLAAEAFVSPVAANGARVVEVG